MCVMYIILTFGMTLQKHMIILTNAKHSFITTEDLPENADCWTPDQSEGKCIQLQQCQPLYRLIQKLPLTNRDREYLRNSKCGFSQQPLVIQP